MEGTKKILALSGPNLNLLGQREPEIYGKGSLDGIHARLRQKAAEYGARLDCFQSNAEHELIERIQAAGQEGCDAIIINPGALTHTSIALRDALLAAAIPFIEVHISNPFSREAFRRRSYLSDIAFGLICGMGQIGYELALDALHRHWAGD